MLWVLSEGYSVRTRYASNNGSTKTVTIQPPLLAVSVVSGNIFEAEDDAKRHAHQLSYAYHDEVVAQPVLDTSYQSAGDIARTDCSHDWQI